MDKHSADTSASAHSGLSFGPADSSELPALAEMIGALFRLESDFRPDVAAQLRGLERLLSAPPAQARIAVARSPQGPVGVAVAQLLVSTSEGALSAWIEDVYVLPGWRGRGVGRALVGQLLDWAQAAGATRAQLLADRGNEPALAFYRRLGWASTQLLPLRLGLGHGPIADR